MPQVLLAVLHLAQGPHIYQGPQIHMPIYPNPKVLGYILIYTYPYIRAEIVMMLQVYQPIKSIR